MSKYEKFINDLKEETYNQKIPNLTDSIKTQYLQEESKTLINKKISNKLICVFLTIIIIFIIIIIPSVKQKNSEKENSKYTPHFPTTVKDTYAFELGIMANIMMNKQEITQKMSNNVELEKVANQLHNEYTTIRQLIYEENSSYEIKQSINPNYEEEMILKLSYNSFDLECSIYYNKILIEKDEEEELYNIDGIVVINNKEYIVIGETEKEEDEIKTKLKIIFTENDYFIIEEEFEDGEQEFVYLNYENNKLIQKSKLQIEKEKKEIEIVITEKGIINGKTKIKYKNNQLIATVNYDDYNGKIEIKDDNEEIKYIFINEKITIELKLIKKNINNTNKNEDYFVY